MVTTADDLEPLSILLSASFECLATFSGSSIVDDLCRRLARYWQDPEGEQKLRDLYGLRSTYVHGRPYRQWLSVEDRSEVLERGLGLVKEILARAIADEAFHAAALTSRKAHRLYLDS
jgi:hypothetical protein